MRRKKLARLLWKLRAMRRSCPKRDQLLMRVGAAKTEAGRAFGYVKIHLPEARQTVTPETFTFQVDKAKLREAQLRDGHYLLRTDRWRKTRPCCGIATCSWCKSRPRSSV